MVDGHRDAVEALRGQLAHDHFEDRVLADRHERLGQDDGIRPQPRAASARQNHRAPRHCRGRSCSAGGCAGRGTRQSWPPRPSSSDTAGLKPVARASLVPSHHSRCTSLPGGPHALLVATGAAAPTPIDAAISSNSSPIADLRARPDVEHLAQTASSSRHRHQPAAGVLDEREVAGRGQRRRGGRRGSRGELRDDGRDDGARRLPRAVGVERPRDDDRQLERVEETERHGVGGDLRRAVRRLRAQRVLFVDRHVLRGAVHLARRGVHEPLDAGRHARPGTGSACP